MDDILAFLNPLAAELAKSKVQTAQPDTLPSDVEYLWNHLGEFEKSSNKAYFDTVAGKWTVGRGQTGENINEGTVWTDDEIRQDFVERAMKTRNMLQQKYGTVFNSMTDNQKMVLQSLLWNAGPSSLEKWPIMRGAMETSDKKKVQNAIQVFGNEIPTIRKVNGKISKGLVNRRAKELEIYNEQK